MKTPQAVAAAALAIFLALGAGCANRMTVATGTTIGLNATPGDGNSQPPQITFAYKRSELAFVPTGERPAVKSKDPNSGTNTDAYSALAIIDFKTKWFGKTSIDEFIATGHAARDIQGQNQFTETLLAGTFIEPPQDIVDRRTALAAKIGAKLNGKPADEQNKIAADLLNKAGHGDVTQPATNVLQRALEDVRTEEDVKSFESAFSRLP